MRPSGHLNSATIGLALLYQFYTTIPVEYMIFFLLGAIFIDIDILYSFISPNHPNHRLFLTHYPPLHVFLLIITFLFGLDLLFWLLLGILFHLCFDWFDWGLPLNPYAKQIKFTPHILRGPSNEENESYFFSQYWNNNIIVRLEFILLIGALLSLVVLPFQLQVLVVVLEIIFTIEIVIKYRKK